jgi:hypothetical protein
VKARSCALAFGVFVALSSTSCDQVPWATSRELCGEIQLVDKQTVNVLKNADLILYRSKSEYVACCSKAEAVSELHTDGSGKFNSGKLVSGRYFVVMKKSPNIAFPVFLERDYDGHECSLNTVFSFDSQTGKTEQIVTIYLDRKNAQTH